jgi:hypothetical protein
MDIERREAIRKNLATLDTTLTQDVAEAAVKVGGTGVVVWTAAALIPFISLPLFILPLGILMILLGFYFRWVR